MEDVRQLSNRMAILERQADVLRSNIEMLQGHIRELLVAKETIGSIKDAEKDQDVLIPLGGGASAYGKLTQNDKILINIGVDIVVKRDIDGAISIIDKRIDEAKTLLERTSSSYGEVTNAMAQLEQRGRQLMEQQSAKK
ncbi:MAG TPA: prefoldin subunit alpha [Candidatus Methanofastidiosa archaeon]|nr:prefoldin subunit alpha [Candidatus Methanofastidiosa archaeon]HPR42007.1 prefoldin subunit alpha [Candidatus Methanofastidiosa archaeon]